MIRRLLEWKSSGTLRRTSRKPSEITELPIGTWTELQNLPQTEVSKAKFSRGRLTLHRGRRTIRSRYATAQDAEAAMTSDALKTYDRAEKSEDD
jgi:hypothetical protein